METTTKNYPLVMRKTEENTIVAMPGGVTCGGDSLFIAAGPCSVEDAEQMAEVSCALASAGVSALRGGVFKPRTSPYSFQGLGKQGLEIMREASGKFHLPVVTEALSESQAELAAQYADMIQIGSRNMQNFELLKFVGRLGAPVLLKRGLAATVEELLAAAEYIACEGNTQIVLCERGIRSYDPTTRNVLDLGAVVLLKRLTHLPVIVDPSHAAGRSDLVADLSRAAIAAGADGLIVECHPHPRQSVSDAEQALSLDEMQHLIASIETLATSVGRSGCSRAPAPGLPTSIAELCIASRAS